MTRSAVLTQSTRVTDGRTDGQTESAWHIRAIAYAVARKKQEKQRTEDTNYAAVMPFVAKSITFGYNKTRLRNGRLALYIYA